MGEWFAYMFVVQTFCLWHGWAECKIEDFLKKVFVVICHTIWNEWWINMATISKIPFSKLAHNFLVRYLPHYVPTCFLFSFLFLPSISPPFLPNVFSRCSDWLCFLIDFVTSCVWCCVAGILSHRDCFGHCVKVLNLFGPNICMVWLL